MSSYLMILHYRACLVQQDPPPPLSLPRISLLLGRQALHFHQCTLHYHNYLIWLLHSHQQVILAQVLVLQLPLVFTHFPELSRLFLVMTTRFERTKIQSRLHMIATLDLHPRKFPLLLSHQHSDLHSIHLIHRGYPLTDLLTSSLKLVVITEWP